MKRLLIATVASITLLAGCGPTMTNRPDSPWSTQSVTGRHGIPMMRQLDLSAEQQTKIQAIMQAHRPQAVRPGKAQRQDLKALLLAPQVDGAKLTAALQDRFGQQQAMIDRLVPMMAELREVLTPEQRAKLAEMKPQHRFAGKAQGKRGGRMNGKRGGKGHGFRSIERMTKGLNLTTEQQRAIDELKAAMSARREAQKGSMAQRQAAMAAFARSGDQAALKAALASIRPAMPIDAIVKVATSLSLEQRQQIAERMSQRHGRFRGRHGKG